MRIARLPLIVFLLLNFVACSRDSKSPPSPPVPLYSPAEGSLAFNIQPRGQPNGQLVASTSRGKTAKFKIELDPAKPSKNTDFPMSFGKGSFSPRITYSNGMAKKIPKKSSRSASGKELDRTMFTEDFSQSRAQTQSHSLPTWRRC
jgi:hypothetical protein